jgi:pimeloyl-ACP methyl ester carboxylesterase
VIKNEFQMLVAQDADQYPSGVAHGYLRHCFDIFFTRCLYSSDLEDSLFFRSIRTNGDQYKMKFLIFLGRILVFLLILILFLPVVLLPTATAVPAWVWISLILVDLGLLVLFFWHPGFFGRQPAWVSSVTSLVGVLVVAILAILLSQAFATTPPITDAQGEPLPGSIASLEKVNLNGSQQWISIRGKDRTKPVLLFLAGGPGGTQLATARFALGGLEDHFVVVNWDQPGAGKSFDAVKRSTLTPERYIQDAHALIEILRERFGEEQIYLVGESWGSVLGIWLVQRYPELFHAFIGTGQMVAFLENDLMCYQFSLDLARERGDTAKEEKLIAQGPPPYYGAGMSLKESTFLMDTFNSMNENPAIADNGFNTFRDLAAPEYGLYDKLSWFRGVIQTLDVVYPQLWEVDFRQQATQLEVPVYFLIGRHDINAPTVLTEQYYDLLQAPHKEIIWFEQSGHTPWVSESDRFVQEVVGISERD